MDFNFVEIPSSLQQGMVLRPAFLLSMKCRHYISIAPCCHVSPIHQLKFRYEWGRQVHRLLVRDRFCETGVPNKTKKFGNKIMQRVKIRMISLMPVAIITVPQRMNWKCCHCCCRPFKLPGQYKYSRKS